MVNASDINEMTENTWYVEGSILDRFLEGEIKLKRPRSHNKILCVTNEIDNHITNAVNAAKVTLGAEIELIKLNNRLEMYAEMKDGKATGRIGGTTSLFTQLKYYDFDALAISSKITVDPEVARKYLTTPSGVNPWGGVEAKLSKLIANVINKPVAHAPYGDTLSDFNKIVDPRKAPEMLSQCYIHCVFKGLHQAPQISNNGLSVEDVDVLVTPVNCIGRPHLACLDAGIPIIAVTENKNVCKDVMPSSFIVVDNYWEAAGIISCMKAGIDKKTVRV